MAPHPRADGLAKRSYRVAVPACYDAGITGQPPHPGSRRDRPTHDALTMTTLGDTSRMTKVEVSR
jgi:hypothetical protein